MPGGMVDLTKQYDELVVGGGNAALCAAIAARREGRVGAVREGAPKFYRGGNTRHTRNIRCNAMERHRGNKKRVAEELDISCS